MRTNYAFKIYIQKCWSLRTDHCLLNAIYVILHGQQQMFSYKYKSNFLFAFQPS